MIGQDLEDAQQALTNVNHGNDSLSKALSLCSSQGERNKEKELEVQILKCQKVKCLKQRQQTQQEKSDLLRRLKETMQQYQTLMQQHSKQAAQNDKPMDTYKYFEDKWEKQDPAFMELAVPDYLICPLT